MIRLRATDRSDDQAADEVSATSTLKSGSCIHEKSTNRQTYIVLLSHGIGGAEKRFTTVWKRLRDHGSDVNLVISEETFAALRLQREFSWLDDNCAGIMVFPSSGSGYIETLRSAWPVLRTLPRGSVVHYPLAYIPVLSTLRGHKLIMSWVNVTLPQLSAPKQWKEWLMTYFSFLEARTIDVLNPENYTAISKQPFLQTKLSLTKGGTTVDNRYYFLTDRKKNSIVFVGRFEPGKNVVPWMERILPIDRMLKLRGVEVNFHVLGSGSEDSLVRNLGESLRREGVDVDVGFADDPAKFLQNAKVFLSLQSSSNYPSKALAEAMACGCIPVITDVGDSRLMCESPPARYVNQSLNVDEMFEVIAGILEMNSCEFSQLSKSVSEIAKSRFSGEVLVDYYRDLYAKADSSS